MVVITTMTVCHVICLCVKKLRSQRVLGDLSTSLNGEGPLVKHTSLSAFDWTGSYGPPFPGGASAPAGKPQPLFHVGSYLTSNSINAATAPAGKPQPLFHAGSYLTSNSINVAKRSS